MKNNGFIVTTASVIEGFRIIDQLGIVYGDAIHKPNFSAMASSRDFSTTNAMFYSSSEMKGTEKLVNEARDYAYRNMKKQAMDIGANAIVGFVNNSSFGNDLIHISLYGTAVRVIPEEEFEKEMELKKEQKQKEQEKREIDIFKRNEEIRERRTNGDFEREEAFMRDIADEDSMIKIWDIWVQSGLNNRYRDIGMKIEQLKNSERMYGKMSGDAKRIKEQISKTLSGE